jgi:hypothetical protein
MADVIDKHINHDLIPLHVIAPHVPPWLGAWCMRLMAQKPDERPVNAQQAIEEFRAWERMPTMVPYMPWMGMYAPPPVYMPPAQPMYMPPGTGTVPLTGYYPPAEAQPAAYAEPVEEAMPVEIIPEARPVVETAAITSHLAPSPRRPGTGRATAVGRKSSSLSASPAPAPGKFSPVLIKKIALIGGSAVVLGIGGCFFFGGDAKKKSSGSAVLSAIGISSEPPKVSFQLPQDRSYPPVDRGIALFYVGNTGILTNRKGSDGKLAPANNNEMVLEWHDLSERGKDNILRSYQNSPDYAPKRANWPEAATGGTPRSGRVVLDFRSRNGKPCALELDDPGKEGQNLPFGGNNVPGNDKGLTIVLAFQAEASKLPMRIFTLNNDDGSSVSLRVDGSKNLVAEAQHKNGSPKLVSKDVNGTIASLAFITWNASTQVFELRARDASGKTYASSGGKCPAPDQPLTRLEIGGVKNAADQFSGYLAEFFAYSAVLKADQIQLIDGRVRDYYFVPAAPSPLKQRLKTKLAWIEPRSSWKLSASHKKEDCAKTVDNNTGSRWATGAAMKGGEWFTIELPVEENIAGIALDSQGNSQDFARKYRIELSANGVQWSNPVAEGGNNAALAEIIFKSPQKGRFVRITQLGSSGGPYWGINELVLFKP